MSGLTNRIAKMAAHHRRYDSHPDRPKQEFISKFDRIKAKLLARKSVEDIAKGA